MAGKYLKKYKQGTRRDNDRNVSADKHKVKTLIIVFLCIVIAGALYFAIPKIASMFENREEETESYGFYPIYIDENIYANKEYMQLDRNYYFEDPSYGTTVSFDPETLSEVPSAYELPVRCIVKYLDCARDGECEELYKLYSDKFFKNGFTAKTGFTVQKIYEAKISIYETNTVSENLGTWDTWYFWVEYKIYKNNGTFRNDMGSDCTRKELFQITYRDGRVEIDAVTPYRLSD